MRLTIPNNVFPKEWEMYLCRYSCGGDCRLCDFMGDMINRQGRIETLAEKGDYEGIARIIKTP